MWKKKHFCCILYSHVCLPHPLFTWSSISHDLQHLLLRPGEGTHQEMMILIKTKAPLFEHYTYVFFFASTICESNILCRSNIKETIKFIAKLNTFTLYRIEMKIILKYPLRVNLSTFCQHGLVSTITEQINNKNTQIQNKKADFQHTVVQPFWYNMHLGIQITIKIIWMCIFIADSPGKLFFYALFWQPLQPWQCYCVLT